MAEGWLGCCKLSFKLAVNFSTKIITNTVRKT